jgi:hypothetical protein
MLNRLRLICFEVQKYVQTGLSVVVVCIGIGVVSAFIARVDQPTSPSVVTNVDRSTARVIEEPLKQDNKREQRETRNQPADTADPEAPKLIYQDSGGASAVTGYSTKPVSSADDSSCSAPYETNERIADVKFEYGFVISRFTAWNEEEGLQDYNVYESDLPRTEQGQLKNIISTGRTVSITKQRCGQGQTASLVKVQVP